MGDRIYEEEDPIAEAIAKLAEDFRFGRVESPTSRRCAIYARTATGGGDAGLAQLAKLRSAVEASGGVVAREYRDINVAGTSSPGYGLSLLLSDLKILEIDLVVVTDISRLGRSLDVVEPILSVIWHRGARVMSIDHLGTVQLFEPEREPAPTKRSPMKLKMKKKTRRKLLKRLRAIREEVEIDYGHMRGATSELLDELIDELSQPAAPPEAHPLEADVAVTFNVIVRDPVLRYRSDVEGHAVGEDALVLHPAGHAVSVAVHNLGPAHLSAEWTSDIAASASEGPVIIAPGKNFVFRLRAGDLRHEPVRLKAVAP